MTAGPILGGVLSEAFGIQAAFFGHAAFAALALLLISTGRRGARAPIQAGEERAHRRVLQTVVEHRREFATAGSVAISLTMVRRARSVLIPLWGAWLGLDLAEIGLVIGLASAIDMTFFYPVGIVMDRWGRKWTIIPCLVTLSLALALVPFTQGFVSFLLVGLLGGIGNGLGSGAVMTLGADLAPPERSGEFLGVWRLISDSGGVISPAIVGGLAQAITLGAAFYAASAIGGAGALLMALRVPEGLQRSRGEGVLRAEK
jgi:MFS family permease